MISRQASYRWIHNICQGSEGHSKSTSFSINGENPQGIFIALLLNSFWCPFEWTFPNDHTFIHPFIQHILQSVHSYILSHNTTCSHSVHEQCSRIHSVVIFAQHILSAHSAMRQLDARHDKRHSISHSTGNLTATCARSWLFSCVCVLTNRPIKKHTHTQCRCSCRATLISNVNRCRARKLNVQLIDGNQTRIYFRTCTRTHVCGIPSDRAHAVRQAASKSSDTIPINRTQAQIRKSASSVVVVKAARGATASKLFRRMVWNKNTHTHTRHTHAHN